MIFTFWKKTEKESIQKKKVTFSTFVLSMGAFFVVLFILLFIAVYFFHDTFWMSKTVDRIVPYPAVVISPGSVVWYGTIGSGRQSLERFYAQKGVSSYGKTVDLDTDEGKKQLKLEEKNLISKLIEDQVIRFIVEKNGKRVTNAEVSQSTDRMLAELGKAYEIQSTLESLYGWNMKEFADRFVRPSLYKEKAMQIFQKEVENNALYVSAKQKIQEAHTRLDKKEKFLDVAKKYSDGLTAENGGYLGPVRIDQLDESVQMAVSALKKGGISDIIESELGFHIILLNEIREEETETLYDISQIFVRKPLFADWVNDHIKQANVRVLLPEYRWNRETGFMEFSDASMRNFESEMVKKYAEANGMKAE